MSFSIARLTQCPEHAQQRKLPAHHSYGTHLTPFHLPKNVAGYHSFELSPHPGYQWWEGLGWDIPECHSSWWLGFRVDPNYSVQLYIWPFFFVCKISLLGWYISKLHLPMLKSMRYCFHSVFLGHAESDLKSNKNPRENLGEYLSRVWQCSLDFWILDNSIRTISCCTSFCSIKRSSTGTTCLTMSAFQIYHGVITWSAVKTLYPMNCHLC